MPTPRVLPGSPTRPCSGSAEAESGAAKDVAAQACAAILRRVTAPRLEDFPSFRRRRRLRDLKSVPVLPSLVTLGNVFAGFLAIAKVADALRTTTPGSPFSAVVSSRVSGAASSASASPTKARDLYYKTFLCRAVTDKTAGYFASKCEARNELEHYEQICIK